MLFETLLALWAVGKPVYDGAKDFLQTYNSGLKAVRGTFEIMDRSRGWFSGASLGAQADVRLQQTSYRTGSELVRLSDRVVIDMSLQEAINRDRDPKTLSDPRSLRELLDPLACTLNCNVFSSQVSSTPRKLKESFARDPSSVLVGIKRADEAVRPEGPHYVPIMFMDAGRPFVGWQVQGALREMLGCDFVTQNSSASGSPRLHGLFWDRVRIRCEDANLTALSFSKEEIEKIKSGWRRCKMSLGNEKVLAVMGMGLLDYRPYKKGDALTNYLAAVPDAVWIGWKGGSGAWAEARIPLQRLVNSDISYGESRFFKVGHLKIDTGSKDGLYIDYCHHLDQAGQFLKIIKNEIQ